MMDVGPARLDGKGEAKHFRYLHRCGAVGIEEARVDDVKSFPGMEPLNDRQDHTDDAVGMETAADRWKDRKAGAVYIQPPPLFVLRELAQRLIAPE